MASINYRMMGLPDRERSVTIYLAVWIQTWRTDRQTDRLDGRTDGQTPADSKYALKHSVARYADSHWQTADILVNNCGIPQAVHVVRVFIFAASLRIRQRRECLFRFTTITPNIEKDSGFLPCSVPVSCKISACPSIAEIDASVKVEHVLRSVTQSKRITQHITYHPTTQLPFDFDWARSTAYQKVN